MPINPTRFRLRLSPQAELAHLVTLAAGLLASGRFVTSRKNDDHHAVDDPDDNIDPDDTGGADFLAVDVAEQLLGQLRASVEADVNYHPERYIITTEKTE
jgi:hypothetical protein